MQTSGPVVVVARRENLKFIEMEFSVINSAINIAVNELSARKRKRTEKASRERDFKRIEEKRDIKA